MSQRRTNMNRSKFMKKGKTNAPILKSLTPKWLKKKEIIWLKKLTVQNFPALQRWDIKEYKLHIKFALF